MPRVVVSMGVSLVNNALGLAAELAIPVIIAALIVTLFVGILQAATQISDEGISFAGRFAAVVIALSLFGSVMVNQVTDFTRKIWENQGTYL